MVPVNFESYVPAFQSIQRRIPFEIFCRSLFIGVRLQFEIDAPAHGSNAVLFHELKASPFAPLDRERDIEVTCIGGYRCVVRTRAAKLLNIIFSPELSDYFLVSRCLFKGHPTNHHPLPRLVLDRMFRMPNGGSMPLILSPPNI